VSKTSQNGANRAITL